MMVVGKGWSCCLGHYPKVSWAGLRAGYCAGWQNSGLLGSTNAESVGWLLCCAGTVESNMLAAVLCWNR